MMPSTIDTDSISAPDNTTLGSVFIPPQEQQQKQQQSTSYFLSLLNSSSSQSQTNPVFQQTNEHSETDGLGDGDDNN
jgi:hypothetical protein